MMASDHCSELEEADGAAINLPIEVMAKNNITKYHMRGKCMILHPWAHSNKGIFNYKQLISILIDWVGIIFGNVSRKGYNHNFY